MKILSPSQTKARAQAKQASEDSHGMTIERIQLFFRRQSVNQTVMESKRDWNTNNRSATHQLKKFCNTPNPNTKRANTP
jgi:hypothetical protein